MRKVLESALDQEASGEDPLARLASLGAPTADIDQMLSEIEAGRK
ncbi:MAG: hypothetical protein RBU36_15885 [Thermoanaerobaculia bacterium]|nr:hypothetical protein [Thermoanaerobaculia bacterium]